MGRVAWVVVVLVLWAAAAWGQGTGADQSRPVKLVPAASGVTDGWWGRLVVELALSRPVPWRVAIEEAPPRLVLDFRTVDWDGLDAGSLVRGDGATGARTGRASDGWSRLVIDLAEPGAVAEAGMVVDEDGGGARLILRLDPADPGDAGVEAPPSEAAGLTGAGMFPRDDGRLVVAIDPGHGGKDPGAERDGLRESHLMLALARELADGAARAGMIPVLTRSQDVFVPLEARMTVAREAGADVLISLHADALDADAAFGASVYTLSGEAAGDASARMVARHERRDLVGGLDLGGADDAVATALLELARQDTAPASRRLAQAVVTGLDAEGARVNSRPLREARLAVLGAADFPSVLVEVGFLSNGADRARLSTPQGRTPIVSGLLYALSAWEADEAARALLRLR